MTGETWPFIAARRPAQGGIRLKKLQTIDSTAGSGNEGRAAKLHRHRHLLNKRQYAYRTISATESAP